uniref:G-protein coupled receptors family 1 profile domain-containing protein n=1 Tax=Amphiprion ocellaris TaxID=80972 RepID=A0AAQ6AA39_AMPOC
RVNTVACFSLSAYTDMGLLNYLCFMLLMCFYLLVICSNLFLMVVICMNRSLQEPMYMFLLSLLVSELYGSTGLLPFLLVQILSDLHTVAAPLCFLQIFCIYMYTEYLTLAIMSYNCYVAVCDPLRYKTRMTSKTVAVLVALTWFYPCFMMVALLSWASPLQLCGSFINKLYCDAYLVVKLSCSDTTGLNIYELIATFSTIIGTLVSILYTYMKIFLVCSSGSQQTRQKAVSTCSPPHLASILNFSIGASFEILQSRFDVNNMPNVLRIFLSLYFLMVPPLVSPLMYGLKMSKIRFLCCISAVSGLKHLLLLVSLV